MKPFGFAPKTVLFTPPLSVLDTTDTSFQVPTRLFLLCDIAKVGSAVTNANAKIRFRFIFPSGNGDAAQAREAGSASNHLAPNCPELHRLSSDCHGGCLTTPQDGLSTATSTRCYSRRHRFYT